MFLRGYYHGNDPWAMKADYPGVLPEDVANNLVVPWFDLPAMEAAYEACGGDVAALIAQPYDHGNFADNRCATKEFWASVRQFCDKRGIVLIIDDVRTGFRLDLQGSDHYYGFQADLICFCKALANGYNMSAVCGQGASEGHRLLHLLHRLLLDERRAFCRLHRLHPEAEGPGRPGPLPAHGVAAHPGLPGRRQGPRL